MTDKVIMVSQVFQDLLALQVLDPGAPGASGVDLNKLQQIVKKILN